MSKHPDASQSGDEWWEKLYEESAAKLILYGRALGLSHSEAEDVLHETFLALIRSGKTPLKPDHYCARAYRNRALNYRRGFWRRLTRELESAEWFEQSAGAPISEWLAMRRLAELPREQREVIVLKIWHGYTFENIGALLEVSPNTAAGRYRYGIGKIRDYLNEMHYETTEHVGEPNGLLETASAVAES